MPRNISSPLYDECRIYYDNTLHLILVGKETQNKIKEKWNFCNEK